MKNMPTRSFKAMTNTCSNKSLEELAREIRKLEVRLEDFLREEEIFAKKLKTYIEKIDDVSNYIRELRCKPKELAKLRLEVTQALNEVLKSESKVQHEKSHILESYGALILAIEEVFLKTCP